VLGYQDDPSELRSDFSGSNNDVSDNNMMQKGVQYFPGTFDQGHTKFIQSPLISSESFPT
jgi:hypothetical protein